MRLSIILPLLTLAACASDPVIDQPTEGTAETWTQTLEHVRLDHYDDAYVLPMCSETVLVVAFVSDGSLGKTSEATIEFVEVEIPVVDCSVPEGWTNNPCNAGEDDNNINDDFPVIRVHEADGVEDINP